MKNIFFTLGVVFSLCILGGCGKNSNDLTFFNDFENIKPWFIDSSVTKGNAHSGEYAVKTGLPHEFSLGFHMKCKEISKNPLKKIKVSVWVNLSDTMTDAVLVTGINSPQTPNVLYDGKPLNKIVRQKDKWSEITAEYFINKGDLNQAENLILVYIWNKGSHPVLMDDLKVSFEEQ